MPAILHDPSTYRIFQLSVQKPLSDPLPVTQRHLPYLLAGRSKLRTARGAHEFRYLVAGEELLESGRVVRLGNRVREGLLDVNLAGTPQLPRAA
jgi:hypothetical protein